MDTSFIAIGRVVLQVLVYRGDSVASSQSVCLRVPCLRFTPKFLQSRRNLFHIYWIHIRGHK